jgi:hypothetical protein
VHLIYFIIRIICIVVITKWAENITSMGDRRSTYRALVKKHERKRPLGRLDVDGRI